MSAWRVFIFLSWSPTRIKWFNLKIIVVYYIHLSYFVLSLNSSPALCVRFQGHCSYGRFVYSMCLFHNKYVCYFPIWYKFEVFISFDKYNFVFQGWPRSKSNISKWIFLGLQRFLMEVKIFWLLMLITFGLKIDINNSMFGRQSREIFRN